ncbi:MAG TPA: hypothetical protein DCZ08_04860 [Anaerolineaceae bacterium]|nr:hypothetical protein [Anaerolineaceae bacterium]
MSYPNTLDTFTPKTDGIHDVMAADINNLQDAVAAIEQSHISPGDWPLKSLTDGDHFRQFASTYPTGWSQIDAAYATNTNSLRSFWFLQGHPTADNSWIYRKRLSVNLESIPANTSQHYMFGPVYLSDSLNAGDITYRFAIHRDSGGVIDTQTYVRCVLKWDNVTQTWQVWGEEKDGTTAHSSAAKNLTFPTPQPLYFRMAILNASNKFVSMNMGTVYPHYSHAPLLRINPTVAPTWGQIWVQMEMSRAATGAYSDILLVGAVDTFNG